MKIVIVAVAALGIGISGAKADDSVIAAGKQLNDKNCVRCHGPELYTRKDRNVTSKANLFTQVQRCESNLKLQWFDEETGSVTEYLNREYYHFK